MQKDKYIIHNKTIIISYAELMQPYLNLAMRSCSVGKVSLDNISLNFWYVIGVEDQYFAIVSFVGLYPIIKNILNMIIRIKFAKWLKLNVVFIWRAGKNHTTILQGCNKLLYCFQIFRCGRLSTQISGFCWGNICYPCWR